jgi:hypothetical protein
MTSRWIARYHNSRCTRKGGLRTAEFADEMAEKASRKTGELIISYKCYDCGRWHIGHADKTQLAARNLKPGEPLPFCTICDRLIPKHRHTSRSPVTTCSKHCATELGRRKKQPQPQTLPEPPVPEGVIPGLF